MWFSFWICKFFTVCLNMALICIIISHDLMLFYIHFTSIYFWISNSLSFLNRLHFDYVTYIFLILCSWLSFISSLICCKLTLWDLLYSILSLKFCCSASKIFMFFAFLMFVDIWSCLKFGRRDSSWVSLNSLIDFYENRYCFLFSSNLIGDKSGETFLILLKFAFEAPVL